MTHMPSEWLAGRVAVPAHSGVMAGTKRLPERQTVIPGTDSLNSRSAEVRRANRFAGRTDKTGSGCPELVRFDRFRRRASVVHMERNDVTSHCGESFFGRRRGKLCRQRKHRWILLYSGPRAKAGIQREGSRRIPGVPSNALVCISLMLAQGAS